MNAWLIPACRLLTPEVGTMISIACARAAPAGGHCDRFRAAAHLDRIGEGACAAWSFGQ